MIKSLILMLYGQIMLNKSHMMTLMTVIMSSVALSLMMFFMTMNHWSSLLLTLLYVSGIMVMFMFVVSLTPNEKSTLKNKKSTIFFLAMASSSLSYSAFSKTSENSKMPSYKNTTFMVMMMILLVVISAYIPPKMVLMSYKGMKTSK